jgi:HSP20 family protein
MNLLTRRETFDPFDELTVLRNRMDRLFGRFFEEDEPTAMTNRWMPAIDIIETRDALIFKTELPGFEEKDVNIEIENNVLKISGERKFEETTKEKTYQRVERAYGKFFRTFTLPVNVNLDKIVATFVNGLLELTVPKKEEAKPKKIALEINKKKLVAA